MLQKFVVCGLVCQGFVWYVWYYYICIYYITKILWCSKIILKRRNGQIVITSTANTSLEVWRNLKVKYVMVFIKFSNIIIVSIKIDYWILLHLVAVIFYSISWIFAYAHGNEKWCNIKFLVKILEYSEYNFTE